MSIYEHLLEELGRQLTQLEEKESDMLTRAEQGMHTSRKIIERMRNGVIREDFKDKKAEQDFFKRIKPQAVSRLIYYMKLFHIESKRPRSSIKTQKQYLAGQIDQLQGYFNDHAEFYHYYRRGADMLDHHYFQRNKEDLPIYPDTLYFSMDDRFSTGHDSMVATILAHDRLIAYLNKEMHNLSYPPRSNGTPGRREEGTLTWTGSKTDVVELIYALYSGKVFNHGQAGIREITEAFEAFFGVRLPQVYRTYASIKDRKGQRARFLEELIFHLSQKIDREEAL
ncbi:RteC domain-containing protein [Sinomicrobium sp. M5D2P17]